MATREQIMFRPFRLRSIGNRVLETFSNQWFNNILMHRGKYIVPKEEMENGAWKIFLTTAFMCVVLQGARGDLLPPLVNAPNYVSVKEDVHPGSVIVNITAQNPWGGEVIITTGSSSVVYLRHNPPDLWLVILNTTLDRETTNSITLIFTAEDQMKLPFSMELFVIDVNDVAPIFQNLPYNVDVKENKTPGTVVYTGISTTDPDDGLGGMVQFSMKGGESGLGEIFTINAQNGDITLTGHLDYEANKFYHYTITAKDGGNLTSVTDLFITVGDVQDTPPYFTRLPYIATIDENTPVNTIVNTFVTALDGDRGIPNNITYNIYSATPSECSNMFTMSSSTGTISVSSLIDRDTAPLTRFNGVCRLFVKATETHHGNNQSANITAEESVTITILDLNDIIPHFSTDTYSATVAENSEIGTPLIIPTQIKVSDEDQDQNSIFYIDVVGEANIIFVAEPPFASYLALVQLKVLNSSQLDYEARPSISIQIRARENTTMGRSNLATVVVNIINLNDELPIFNQPNYSAVVPENSAAHQSVLTVQASDKDSGSFGRITYTLEGDSERFDVDATGVIWTRDAMLDRETKDKYLLTVVATDGGGQRAVAPLTITVSDVNDNDPYFTTSYSTSISENNRVPAFLLKLTAFDKDQENTSYSSLTYHIKSCTPIPCSNFSLDEQSGQLNVVSVLDYEQMQHVFGKIEIIVEARDKGSPPRSGNATVVITVEDMNDLDPSFIENSEDNTMDSSSGSSIDLPVVNAPHSISVREDVPLGSVLRTIKATDPAGRPVPVVTESNSVIWIEESTNGNWNIILNTILDREVTSGMSLSFTADPHGRIPLPFCIYMEVQDVNDVAPIFQNLPYNVDLREDVRSNQVVYTNISAFDPDEGAGGIVTFYMEDMTHHSAVNSNASFHIDPVTGKILFTGTLDYETNRYYHYSVTAVDGGNLSSVTDLFIAVVQPSFLARP